MLNGSIMVFSKKNFYWSHWQQKKTKRIPITFFLSPKWSFSANSFWSNKHFISLPTNWFVCYLLWIQRFITLSNNKQHLIKLNEDHILSPIFLIIINLFFCLVWIHWCNHQIYVVELILERFYFSKTNFNMHFIFLSTVCHQNNLKIKVIKHVSSLKSL